MNNTIPSKKYWLDETIEDIGKIITCHRDQRQFSLDRVSFTFRNYGFARSEWQNLKRKVRNNLLRELGIQLPTLDMTPENAKQYNERVGQLLKDLGEDLNCNDSKKYSKLIKAYDNTVELIQQEHEAYEKFKNDPGLVEEAINNMVEYHKSKTYKEHMVPKIDRVLKSEDSLFRPRWWVMKNRSFYSNDDGGGVEYTFGTRYKYSAV